MGARSRSYSLPLSLSISLFLGIHSHYRGSWSALFSYIALCSLIFQLIRQVKRFSRRLQWFNELFDDTLLMSVALRHLSGCTLCAFVCTRGVSCVCLSEVAVFVSRVGDFDWYKIAGALPSMVWQPQSFPSSYSGAAVGGLHSKHGWESINRESLIFLNVFFLKVFSCCFFKSACVHSASLRMSVYFSPQGLFHPWFRCHNSRWAARSVSVLLLI